MSIMIAPDIWFTLYALAKKGAIHGKSILTTREVGNILGLSQQTASRKITHCVEQGLLTRSHTANGMLLQITKRGVKELHQVYTGLDVAFAPSKEEIVIEGCIVGGLGEGAYYVGVYASRFKEALGFEPYIGTLNVKLVDAHSERAVTRMKHSPPLVVSGFSHESRTFGDVICYRVLVNREIEAAVVVAQRTHHSPNILEVIAPVNLREKLNLKNDDMITLTLVPLHLV